MQKNEMMQNLNIREARQTDVPLILDMIKELAVYEDMLDCVEATEEIVVASLFIRNKANALIVEYKTKPIGYVIYFYNFSTFTGRPGLYIEDIYIAPEMRKNGFGKYIFRYLAQIAKEENCARIEWACLDWNEASIRFYKSMDAVDMNEWTIYRLDEHAIDQLLQ
ncbi:MAG: N-acetyltransferase family protein [Anaerofustis sp.]